MQIPLEWRTRLEKHWLVLLALALALVILLTFAPIFAMGFVTDDFVQVGMHHYDALDALARDDVGLWLARLPERVLTDPVNNAQVVRPVRIGFFIADYFQWHLNPFGYHLTNLLFYFGACFSVGLLAWALTKSRGVAFLGALAFALMPVHAAPVAEIASRGHVLAGMFVALTVTLYILPPTRKRALLSWLMYILALGSKETALVAPALLVLYELVYTGRGLVRDWRAAMLRLLPFFLITLGYFGLRYLLFGRVSSLAEASGGISWNFLVAGYTQYAVQPLFDDINDDQMRLVLAIAVVLLLLYHRRREVWFGSLWYPLALLPVLFYPPQERYFFTPSIGLALVLGSILAQPFPSFRSSRSGELVRERTPFAKRPSKVLSTGQQLAAYGLAFVVLLGMGIGLYTRNTEHRAASALLERILSQLKEAHPTLPSGAQLYMLSLPERVRHGYIFTHPRQVEYAVKLAYDDPSLRVETPAEFPTRLAHPDTTYFFEFEDRNLAERADLVQQIRERRTCADASDGAIRWTWRKDLEGWEAWNQIEDFRAESGFLNLRTTGMDAFMGSPLLDIKPQELARVEIKLRARSERPTLNAELFWQTENMEDFSGEARAGFQVNADGASHTYTLEPAVRGDAPVIRLRLDPADAPAEIELQVITLYCH